MDVILLNELSTKIDGLNSGVTSTLSNINNNVSSVKTVCDNIYSKVDTEISNVLTNTNTNNAASATGTLSQKLSWIGNSLIGATSNTGGSSTAGTVMAKLNSIMSKPRCVKTSVSPNTSSCQSQKEVLNISGHGKLYSIASYGASSYIKVIADGVHIGSSSGLSSDAYSFQHGSTGEITYNVVNVEFASSCIVKLLNYSCEGTAYANIFYTLF